MQINKIYIVFGILVLITGCRNNQISEPAIDFYEKCRKLVLSENVIGQEYIFEKIQKEELNKIHITYLGYIITKDGDSLKILNSVNYFNPISPRAHGAFYLYQKDKLLGSYYVGGTADVPNRIENNNLVFDYYDEDCNQTTIINFSDSIPQQIFVKCTENNETILGDVYSFSPNEK